ncbi:MAG TPA: hypothetical protein VHG91_06275 [Longimicrobium sp.]|nr:hypothetical protein [Longimicrobium sp.]
MANLTLDPNALEVSSFDPTPAGPEDQAQLTPGWVLVGAGLYALSDAYC